MMAICIFLLERECLHIKNLLICKHSCSKETPLPRGHVVMSWAAAVGTVLAVVVPWVAMDPGGVISGGGSRFGGASFGKGLAG